MVHKRWYDTNSEADFLGGAGAIYHDQPRLFLSFSDAFTYIKRHDEALQKKAVPNVMTLWYNSRRG